MAEELDREDWLSMLKGTGGPKDYAHPFGHLGEITGFPNEKWYWNKTVLNSMTADQLKQEYYKLKAFNSKKNH